MKNIDKPKSKSLALGWAIMSQNYFYAKLCLLWGFITEKINTYYYYYYYDRRWRLQIELLQDAGLHLPLQKHSTTTLLKLRPMYLLWMVQPSAIHWFILQITWTAAVFDWILWIIQFLDTSCFSNVTNAAIILLRSQHKIFTRDNCIQDKVCLFVHWF